MNDKPVAIIIATWNALEYTKRCLDSIKATIDPHHRVIIVDNGSSDGTQEYLESLDWLTLIKNPTNLGFTRACNLGIEATDPDEDVVLLNNDVILSGDWIHGMQKVAYSEPNIGVVGCRLIDPSGRINHLGSYMPPVSLFGHQMGGEELDIGQGQLDREADSVIFAVVYITRECIKQIGVLDEDYFAYFEDTDYCFRTKRAGLRVMYAGSVTALHHHNTSTRENKTEFWDIYLESQNVFRSKWTNWLEEERYDLSVVWHSVMSNPLAYALTSRKIMSALHFAGVKVAFQNAYGEDETPPNDHLLADILNRKPTSDSMHLAFCMAQYFSRVKGKRRVGWTMLEVTGLPEDWVEGCNSTHEVWVPGSFNVETFSQSGVRVPIRVMPLGIDTNYFNKSIRGFPPTDRFTFLSVFEWGERKAPEVLLRAFAEEFKNSDDVVLLLSIFNRDPDINIPREITKLNLPEEAPIVVIVNAEFAPYQMGSLYRSANCFVLPTRGEGFGMPILEAMACGLPVIATNWSATTDYLDDTVGYPLEFTMQPAIARCPYYEGFDWADPDPDHLMHLMRQVYENPKEANQKGSLASERVAERYTLEHVAARVRQRLLELE